MPKITLEHVEKRFDKFVAVKDLNMVIDDRDFITLLGPSGCGKTTTLRMIAGLESPTEGKITIGDKVVFDAAAGIDISPAKREIGFLFQNYALWPHMTVFQNIAFGLQNLKWSKPEIRKRVDEMLTMLKIEQFEHRYPGELSGGQQQRVAIARTLAPRPKVLFMDEPLSNLDAKLRLEMRTELKRLHSETDSTFLYVTHDQLEAMTLATKICLLKEGVMQQYDAPLDIYNAPNNIFVADFVGNPTMNFIPAQVRLLDALHAEIQALGTSFVLKSKIPLNPIGENSAGTNAVLGVCPEFLHLGSGPHKGKVYATLPAGMETTVKIDMNDLILTSVEFGSVDYEPDSEINFAIHGSEIILFDAQTGNKIGKGKVRYGNEELH